jgi:2-(1,2-epoxy-1,2-dihydrophenyl)acetyl-CoA isomerase
MDFQFIRFNALQGIATIMLNRSREMNRLNLEMIKEMNAALELCRDDRSIRVLIITGGNRIFSAGDDLEIMEMMQEKSEAEIAAILAGEGYPSLIKKIIALPKPVIASVSGMCYGSGGEIALACDYVIASHKARFGQLSVHLGLLGNTYLLPRQIGVKKALELICTGKIITAEEAYQMGMINDVVSNGGLLEETQRMAQQLALGPTLAYGMAKKAVYDGGGMNVLDGLDLMCKLQGTLMKSRDHIEGRQAFLEKREPNFKGE